MSLGVRRGAEIDGVAKYQWILGRILEAVIVRVARQGDVRTPTAPSENWRVTANLDLSLVGGDAGVVVKEAYSGQRQQGNRDERYGNVKRVLSQRAGDLLVRLT